MVKRGQIITLDIEDFAFGGKGIARLETENGKYVLFVQNAFPGQKVLAQVKKKLKKHAECKLVKVLERSPKEVSTPFQEISGAPYIHVPVDVQEAYKKEVTLEVYKRIGGLENVDELFDEFIPSPTHYHYRNKMEYSFSCIEHDIEKDEELDDVFALGFKHRGTWWKVESLNKASGLFDEKWENFLHEFRVFLENTGLPAWHPPKKEGFFRHLVVRKSFYEDRLLINLVTSSQGVEQFDLEAAGNFLKEKCGDRIAGFQHTINDNVADRAKIENGQCTLAFGKDHVIEELNGLFFEISMESFFQTNPESAVKLYNKAMEYVFEGERDLEGKVVMDLFCGTGTIGQLLAKRTNDIEIIGVDIVKEAIEDAKRNAKRNKVKDIQFFAADVGKFLLEFPDFKGKIDTIVLDPPRAGITPKTLRKVVRLNAQRIVYISCNPATQARDIQTLNEFGYITKKLSLIDQFPHTSHIEAIGLFEKEDEI